VSTITKAEAVKVRSSIWNDLQGYGVQERYYDAGGVRTRVLEAGDPNTKPLFLLHGTTGHAEAFCRNIGPLSKERHVIAPDMLGHGYTDHDDDADYGLGDFADHLIALADTLGVEEVDLSGESLGAMVAAWFAIHHPDRVGRILMGTGLLRQAGEAGRQDIEALLDLTAKIDQNLTFDTLKARMKWLVADPDDMTDEMVMVRYKIFTEGGKEKRLSKTMHTVLSWLAGRGGDGFTAPGLMARIQCPTLIFWTTHNPIWTNEMALEAVAEIPHSQYELIDSGHWPQFERPEETNAIHRKFFNV
jgi:2-hydroxy-6-oxonona-2,4-dienedioate hydrolase